MNMRGNVEATVRKDSSQASGEWKFRANHRAKKNSNTEWSGVPSKGRER